MAILESISRALFKTPGEEIKELLIIVALFLVIPLLSALYRVIHNSRSIRQWQRDFHRVVRNKNLAINEIDLLDKLAGYLVEPRRKILLLENRNTLLFALARLEAREGTPAPLAGQLVDKIFGEDKEAHHATIPFGSARPARYIASDGQVYTGQVSERQENLLILGHLKKTAEHPPTDESQVYIQDSHGIAVFPVVSANFTPPDSVTLKITSFRNVRAKPKHLASVYIDPGQGAKPVKARLRGLSGRVGIIENPGKILRKGQTVKVSLETDLNKRFHANALIVGLSVNRSKAKLKFGYLKDLSGFHGSVMERNIK